MRRRPPGATRPDTLCPDTTLVRSVETAATCAGGRGRPAGPQAGRAVPRGRLLHDEVVVDLVDPVDLGGDAPGAVLGGLRVHEAAQLHLALQGGDVDLKRSEEHTSELQSLMRISYAVFCLKKKR